jgi:hypothetical protein
MSPGAKKRILMIVMAPGEGEASHEGMMPCLKKNFLLIVRASGEGNKHLGIAMAP